MEAERQAEALRPYFDVQLRFAEAMAEKTAGSIGEACLTYTNLHRRFGLGRIAADGPAPAWGRYAEGLAVRSSHAERLDWTVAVFADSPRERRGSARVFGCFSYEMLEGERVVKIHFSNREGDDASGPLASAKAERRRSELREMFGFIRSRHPSAETVLGGSWLYNLEAYRRLFPPAYAASAFEPERVRLDGTSSWGQLLDFRGNVKPAVRQALLHALADLDAAAPWRSFPLRALGARCGIEAFYRFY